MALRNSFKITISLFFLLCCKEIMAKNILPELMTKQAVNNIRLISADGKYTYYQKRSGSLLFSTNYKVVEILKGEIGTDYTLSATPAHKKIAVSQNLTFHNFFSLRLKENIYLINFGDSVAKKIGTGKYPKLHLNDSWLSYFDPYEKIIFFENTFNDVLKFSIKLNNRINPYFIPQVVMSDDDTVYYTDLGENGAVGLIQFKRSSSKSELIFKAPSPMAKAEICLLNDQLIVGTMGVHFSKEGTIFSKSSMPLKDYSKREVFYKSEQNDLGHMICESASGLIYIVKNYGDSNLPTFDIASIEISTGKITQLTELKDVTNIVNMDGILITQNKGKYFIVKGESDFKSIDSFKSPKDSEVKSEEKK